MRLVGPSPSLDRAVRMLCRLNSRWLNWLFDYSETIESRLQLVTVVEDNRLPVDFRKSIIFSPI